MTMPSAPVAPGAAPAATVPNLSQAWQAWRHVWAANRRHLGSLLAAGLVINLLSLTLPLFSVIVYDKIIGNAATASLWALALGMGLGVLLDAVLRHMRALMVEHVGARWDRALDERVFQGVLRAPLAQPPGIGPVLTRYREVLSSRDFLSAAYLLPLADLPFIGLFVAVIALLGGPMALLAVAFGMLLLGVSWLAHRQALRHQLRLMRSTNEKMTLMADTLAALETLRRPASGARAAQRFVALSQAGTVEAGRARVWMALVQSASPGLSVLSSVGTLVLGVYLVEAQRMTLGSLIACSMLVGRCVMLFGSVAALVTRHRDFVRAVTELGQVLRLAESDEVKPRRRAPLPGLSSPEFTLSRAGFQREGSDRAVLQEVSLQIPPNQFVAIVGRSGAGKSTLLRLLAGRLSVTEGSLAAGGVPVDERNAAWLAGCVGYKAQEPQFIAMTVGELLADAGEHATPAERLAVLRAVGLGPALAAGELNLATALGPFGAGVSGGQRQMLGLACAVLAGGQVLLLDEPTQGLDSHALQQVVALLASLKGTRTIVLVTHATELIELADRLILVGDGRVMADGPRDKLLVPGRAPPPAAHLAAAAAASPAPTP